MLEAIVGQKQFPQKSTDIIRSLNGTWFKDTSHPETCKSRFFSSLGMKRGSSKLGNRLNKTTSVHEIEAQFHSTYTPPNLFPGRRHSPAKGTTRPVQKKISLGEPANAEVINTVLRRANTGARSRAVARGSHRSRSSHGLPRVVVGE